MRPRPEASTERRARRMADVAGETADAQKAEADDPGGKRQGVFHPPEEGWMLQGGGSVVRPMDRSGMRPAVVARAIPGSRKHTSECLELIPLAWNQLCLCRAAHFLRRTGSTSPKNAPAYRMEK